MNPVDHKKIVMLGSGGHAKVLVDTLQAAGLCVDAILDDNVGMHGTRLFGVSIIGSDEELLEMGSEDVVLVNGVGSTHVPERRAMLFERMRQQGFEFMNVVHPTAVVSAHARLGMGVQVLAGAIVQAGVVLGDNCIVNSGACVDHDCSIGAHTHIAPGTTLSGDVNVGAKSHVGVGATVIQGVRIGGSSLIGAGAVVLHDVPERVCVVGVPAKAMHK